MYGKDIPDFRNPKNSEMISGLCANMSYDIISLSVGRVDFVFGLNKKGVCGKFFGIITIIGGIIRHFVYYEPFYSFL